MDAETAFILVWWALGIYITFWVLKPMLDRMMKDE